MTGVPWIWIHDRAQRPLYSVYVVQGEGPSKSLFLADGASNESRRASIGMIIEKQRETSEGLNTESWQVLSSPDKELVPFSKLPPFATWDSNPGRVSLFQVPSNHPTETLFEGFLHGIKAGTVTPASNAIVFIQNSKEITHNTGQFCLIPLYQGEDGLLRPISNSLPRAHKLGQSLCESESECGRTIHTDEKGLVSRVVLAHRTGVIIRIECTSQEAWEKAASRPIFYFCTQADWQGHTTPMTESIMTNLSNGVLQPLLRDQSPYIKRASIFLILVSGTFLRFFRKASSLDPQNDYHIIKATPYRNRWG